MSGDAIKDFEARDRAQTRALSRYPRCKFCGNRIQSEGIYILDNECACDECIDDRRHSLDDWLTAMDTDGGCYGLF